MSDLTNESKIAREVLVRRTNDQTIYAADIMLYGRVDGSFPLRIHCECANPNCTELVEVKKHKVSLVHQVSSDFIVAPGHNDGSVENIVERSKHYLVVRKHDATTAGQIQKVADQLNLTNRLLNDLGSSPHMIRYFNQLAALYSRKSRTS